ncbi:response regulator [Paenibacillus thailandensis]|uniref:Response regulator n=1 Tax=Paenibacillus thailandensis TaxID=393250 RepID=A0ABW5QVI2_9BACL
MDSLCKILIVDDEILARQGFKHLINWEQEGFTIVGEASNGQEALRLIERLRPHIVVTDIVMPVMDGEKLTRIAKERYPAVEFIVLSSFGEFDYVRSTFQSGVADYILKPKLEADKLLAILKATARKIPGLRLPDTPGTGQASVSQLLEKLIAGYDADYDLDAAAGALPYAGYALFGVDLRRIPDRATADITAKLEEELRSRVEPLALEPIPADGSVVVYLANAGAKDLNGLKEAAYALAGWSEEHAPGAGWLVGDTFAELQQLGSQYRNRFAKLADYRFYWKDADVLAFGQLPPLPPAEPKFDMSRFTDDMNRHHFDEAFLYLRQHVRELAGYYKLEVFEFKSFLSNMIFNIAILLGNLGFDVKDLEESKYGYFKTIDEAKHAEEAIAHLEMFVSEARSRLAGKQEAANPNMKKLLDYIKEHYAEPLSLTGVATHFHFNPSYLSNYFATHNKEGFSEYLNKIRVEKAAELLRTETASISEISGMVGYSDHSYFTKVFKKLTGLSPSLYRKQYGLKDREWL